MATDTMRPDPDLVGPARPAARQGHLLARLRRGDRGLHPGLPRPAVLDGHRRPQVHPGVRPGPADAPTRPRATRQLRGRVAGDWTWRGCCCNTCTTRSARSPSSWSSTWPPPTRCPSCGRCSATLILGMMLATLMIPAAVLVVPQYLTVLDLPLFHVNLLDTPWAIWLPTVTNAFNIFLLKRFFDSIPEELLDAGRHRRRRPAADPAVRGAADVAADPRRRLDLRGGQRVEGLPLADAGRSRTRRSRPLNIGINSLSQGVPENVLIAGLAIASTADADLLPALPAQHHVRSHRGQPQGLTPAAACPRTPPQRPARPGTPSCPKGRLRGSPPCPRHATGGAARRSTRCTCAASPTATATAPATSPGVRARLPYLAGLGVDAIWFTPWYPSPMADGGYDVADYRAIDPSFGTLAEAEKLIEEAHGLGIRVIIDVVPNHCLRPAPLVPGARSRPAPAAPSASCSGSGPAAASTANCRRTTGRPSSAARPGPASPDGEWYLHLFTPEQPDFNWDHPPCARSTRTCCGSGSTRGAAGVRDRLGRTARQGPGARRRRRGRTERLHRPGRAARRSTAPGGAVADDVRRTVLDRRGVAARPRALRPLSAPRRAAHRLQLRLPVRARGTRRSCGRPST